jgi:hypothetical protein
VAGIESMRASTPGVRSLQEHAAALAVLRAREG